MKYYLTLSNLSLFFFLSFIISKIKVYQLNPFWKQSELSLPADAHEAADV